MAKDTTCTIVSTSTGSQYVLLPNAGRVFYNYVDFDRRPQGWAEAQVSWGSMSRHMMHVDEELENQPIPEDLRRHLDAGT